MKKTSTLLMVSICLLLTLTASTAKSQNLFQLNFNTVPTLLSGVLNQLGAKYRFLLVRTGMDAIVTIKSSYGGATVDIFDDNTVSKPEAFSPKVKVPAGQNGCVEFEIKFVHTLTESDYAMDSLSVTAIDIDGNANLKETDIIDMGGGTTANYMANNPEISVTKSGNVWTGTNIGGKEYDNIDSTAKQVMYTVNGKNVKSFIYKAGANNAGTETSRQKSIYFKNFSYAAQTVLAVKYNSFDATAADKSVTLKWVTSEETNNDHFEVERSFSNDFHTIGLVLDAESKTNNLSTYRFKDNAAELQGKSVVYYRLKQIDKDGKYTYSTVLAVRLQAVKADVVMQVSPNPVAEKMYVRFTATDNGNAEVRIINFAGQQTISQQSTISKGYNTVLVNGLNKLAPGMYVAQLVLNGVVIDSQKIVKN